MNGLEIGSKAFSVDEWSKLRQIYFSDRLYYSLNLKISKS